MAANDTQWPARDAYPLGVGVFEPDRAAAATVIISGAVAVRRRFYRQFAGYLCAQGLRVITYDYRGIGSSLRGEIRHSGARMLDWARLDLAAVIDQAAQRYPATPLLMVGHSAGGQFAGLVDNNERLQRLLTIGAQIGYWGHWPAPRRYALMGLWHVLMPGLTAALGYFPARRLGIGEDLPAGVAREWARWCRHEAFFVDPAGKALDTGFSRFSAPLMSVSIADDGMAPRPAVDALSRLFLSAACVRRHIEPAEAGVERLGHFGPFRPQAGRALWPEMAAWLLEAP